MAGAAKNLQLNTADGSTACYVAAVQPEQRGEVMADDAVMEILTRIQASIVALDEKTQASIADLDRKFTTQTTVLAQDIRLIRAGIQDMVRTRVTAGEVDVLHEDMSKLQLGLIALTIRVETLEHSRPSS
jgi:hypothetical protein